MIFAKITAVGKIAMTTKIALVFVGLAAAPAIFFGLRYIAEIISDWRERRREKRYGWEDHQG